MANKALVALLVSVVMAGLQAASLSVTDAGALQVITIVLAALAPVAVYFVPNNDSSKRL